MVKSTKLFPPSSSRAFVLLMAPLLVLLFLSSFSQNGSAVASKEILLHIAPLEYGFLDASGLLLDQAAGSDLNDLNTLQIQLYQDGPVWTIQNLNTATAAEHFVGESDDGMIACDLMRYSSSAKISVLSGRVYDRPQNVWYEIKPNAQSQVTVTTIPDKEIRKPGHPKNPSAWNAVQSLNPFQRLPDLNSMNFLRNNKDDDDDDDGDKEEQAKSITIDMMILWTKNAECYRSRLDVDCELTDVTLANMEAAVDAMVKDANVIFSNSETYTVFRLVHMRRDTSGYREESMSKTLEDLARPVFNCELNYVQKLRNNHKADLVTFIIDPRLDTDPYGGLALGINPAGFPSPTFPISFLAYNILSASTIFGSGYTAAHEWGHLLGCNHDRGTTNEQNSCWFYDGFACDDFFDTAYGYRDPDGEFRTIMSYSCEEGQCDNYEGDGPCFTIPYFSGTYATYNDKSLGGLRNNCRDAILRNRRDVARYR